jgi:hypothetical protein
MRTAPVSRLFRGLQQTVEMLHDVQLDLDVCAYLVDDQVRRRFTPGLNLPEQLLVSEAEDAVELALYVDPQVVSTLQRDDPYVRLHGANYAAYCVALEGVSHFVYVAWRAAAGWSTTALELELQAEVDKFVSSWLLLSQQGPTDARLPHWLLQQLFRRFSLHAAVPAEERQRYWLASRSAASFCTQLVQRFGGDSLGQSAQRALLQQVRRFSRDGLQPKLAAL